MGTRESKTTLTVPQGAGGNLLTRRDGFRELRVEESPELVVAERVGLVLVVLAVRTVKGIDRLFSHQSVGFILKEAIKVALRWSDRQEVRDEDGGVGDDAQMS